MPGNASQAIIAVMLRLLVATLAALFRSRSDLILENLALRQQFAVCKDRYVLVFVAHHRRRILHWAVTRAPTPRYLILDRDALFNSSILGFIRDLGTKPVQIGRRQPWQNGICERWIGSVRRELRGHVVVFHERHLHRLLTEYVACFLDDRPHLALGKDAPAGRRVERPPQAGAEIVSFPRVGGLHHRYGWRAAA